MELIAATVTFLLFLQSQGVSSQTVVPTHYSPCNESSCYPATGDLLVGRESQLSATSTCGLKTPSRYCIVSHLEDHNTKCFVCDSTAPFGLHSRDSHQIENIASTFHSNWRAIWWQAENGVQNVSMQLDLEAEFHFTHLIMRFKTFRPAAMLIERSYDFGKTWKVYRYFAYDCADSFPSVATTPIRHIQDVICESRYSDVAPSAEGEVIFRVLPVNVRIDDPYSEQVQDLLKMTNLRVNFTKLHTLGDNLLDSRAAQIKEKYYYSMYNMVVRGSCSCYGHASRCVPLPGQPEIKFKVHGRCECTHNTKGLNCEQCDDFYNDLPWRPARGRETNACEKCDCNEHSNKCHFDPAVYEATGRTSGGVCDDCRDNTMGHHCEECKPFFYHEPGREITDPYACRHCDCDPIGSEHGGECESRSDPEHGVVAGRCICKPHVEGRRCDVCRDGFWNMMTENPDGCEPCGCFTSGTIGNYGCDKHSGECRCKRYVTGRQCDQCLAGYWNLGDEPQGCESCDCDVGGSYDINCDLSTGQCKCRPNVIGRQCNQPRPGYFVTTLDWQRYEAEFARPTGNTVVTVREPIPGRPITWTGTGFMRIFEGSSLEFLVDDLPMSMEYDVIIRYEPQTPLRWDNVRLTVVRPGPVDERGACANTIPQDDVNTFRLNQGHREVSIPQSVCLERGVTYTIRLDFIRYRGDRISVDASALIDSIVLMPSMAGHPLMRVEGSLIFRDEFERYGCQRDHQSAFHSPMSDVCKKLVFSSSVTIYDGALDCDCDPVGSESVSCDPFGGQCSCKPNVMGRRCDQCFPGTFGFGPAGCIACDCNEVGSRDKICDLVTGQCKCVPNAHGRQCDECERGFYGFPSCRLCQCSGRSDICDSETGECLSCRDHTGGHNCERCADGYYGDPRPDSPSRGCHPCLCPGGHGSGFQHGDTCRLDTRSGQVVCNCRPGYAGLSCNRCANNFFGNPLVPGGTCEQCECHNNIDPQLPGSCDADTGECLKCLYNTEGAHCEHCKLGFYGDASRQNCRACACNILGTHRSEYRSCDRVTGQCHCLPHVTGLHCDSCEANYWKLASGAGCEQCACDPTGSVSAQCNEFDGQCECLPGRGGRDCSECQDLFWGDPSLGCQPCNCDRQGSASLQCNRRTGQCECAVGVAGVKCDRCDRGTTGILPYCVPCGECYDNWDILINELRTVVSPGRTANPPQNPPPLSKLGTGAAELRISGVSIVHILCPIMAMYPFKCVEVVKDLPDEFGDKEQDETTVLIQLGGEIKIGGAPGAFENEFREIEEKLEEVKQIVAGANISVEGLQQLLERVINMRRNLTESSTEINEIDDKVQETTEKVEKVNNQIEGIKMRVENLKKAALELRENATRVQEMDVSGAYESIKESHNRSVNAQKKVDSADAILERSEDVREEIDRLIQGDEGEFEQTLDENQEKLTDLNNDLEKIVGKITDLNNIVCDGHGDPCDSSCGGAGCGRCGGGLSCQDGAVSKSLNAGEFSKRAETLLMEKQKDAESQLKEVNSIKDQCDTAAGAARMTYEKAELAKNESESNFGDLHELLEAISEFLEQRGAKPFEIRSVAEEVLAMTISLTPDEIIDLAKQITNTIQSLTDIDAILEATRDDLNTVNDLKRRADDAKNSADDVLSTAQRIIDLLRAATVAQMAAEKAITEARLEINMTDDQLKTIEEQTFDFSSQSESSRTRIYNLTDRIAALKQKFAENQINVQRATEEALRAEQRANKAEKDAIELESKYADASLKLETKANETRIAKQRADELKDRASVMYQSIYSKVQTLQEMEGFFNTQEMNLKQISEQINLLSERMVLYLQDIYEATKFHRTCSL